VRTGLEKKNDREIDRAYQSTTKALQDTEKKKSDPWPMSAQLHQRRPRTNNKTRLGSAGAMALALTTAAMATTARSERSELLFL
jgi:ferric-dicitrate binding protein FerR (iron transport regulator)